MESKTLYRGLLLSLAFYMAGYSVAALAELQITAKETSSGLTVVQSVHESPHLSAGYAYVETGKYQQALKEFDQALAELKGHGDAGQEARIRNATGYALYLQHRGESLDPQEMKKNLNPGLEQIKMALDLSSKTNDAVLEGWIRVSLGLVYSESGDKTQAAREFRQSLALARANADNVLEYVAELQLARIEALASDRLAKLQTMASRIPLAQMNDHSKVNLLLNVIDQLRQMEESGQEPSSVEVRRLGYNVAEKATTLAAKAGLSRAQSQAEGYWAGLYAQEGKTEEAARQYERAIRHGIDASAPDLTMIWESRLGSLLAKQGREEPAIDTYRRAAFHVSEVRNNIPIYQNGKSSYRETLEPIYRGLADLLMRAVHRTDSPEGKQKLLVESIQSLERLKQSEMEDYFNDRCAFDSAQSEIAANAKIISGRLLQSTVETDKTGSIAASLGRATGKTAIIYPILFKDRLELLFVNNGTIRHETVAATSDQVERQTVALAGILRTGRDYRTPSHQLYQWLMAPIEKDLHDEGIERLVYIPDGVLRLVPLSALSDDGKDFVARRFVVTTNSSLQNVPSTTGAGGIRNALLGGVSKPSETLLNSSDLPDALLASFAKPSMRSLTVGEEAGKTSAVKIAQIRTMRGHPDFRTAVAEALALPEVETEIRSVHQTMPSGTTLLNQDFTSNNLKTGFQSGNYQLAHISTHSYFGHSASESFIMAYDEIIKVNDVEDIMKPPEGMRQPMELVTFSACETAQGDDRAPLGFSGLAIKGKIQNAIGALWAIDDKATRRFMEEYYTALAKTGGDKAKALQQAQLTMLSDKDQNEKLYHPSKWAPFILIGAW